MSKTRFKRILVLTFLVFHWLMNSPPVSSELEARESYLRDLENALKSTSSVTLLTLEPDLYANAKDRPKLGRYSILGEKRLPTEQSQRAARAVLDDLIAGQNQQSTHCFAPRHALKFDGYTVTICYACNRMTSSDSRGRRAGGALGSRSASILGEFIREHKVSWADWLVSDDSLHHGSGFSVQRLEEFTFTQHPNAKSDRLIIESRRSVQPPPNPGTIEMTHLQDDSERVEFKTQFLDLKRFHQHLPTLKPEIECEYREHQKLLCKGTPGQLNELRTLVEQLDQTQELRARITLTPLKTEKAAQRFPLPYRLERVPIELSAPKPFSSGIYTGKIKTGYTKIANTPMLVSTGYLQAENNFLSFSSVVPDDPTSRDFLSMVLAGVDFR